LWPHMNYGGLNGTIINGVKFNSYQVTNMGSTLDDISMFCHENGHLLFDWFDTYNTASGGRPTLGYYDLMAINSPLVPPNPYFRYISGWGNFTEHRPNSGVKSINANQVGTHILKSFNSQTEYFLVENVQATGRWSSFVTSG